MNNHSLVNTQMNSHFPVDTLNITSILTKTYDYKTNSIYIIHDDAAQTK